MTRRAILLSGLAPVLAAAALALYRPVPIVSVDAAVYDTMLRAARPRAPDPRIVIVDVDERSLSAIGQWPWPRNVMGRLVDRLREGGAAVIALDVIFAEPDRYGEDQALAAALHGGRVVLGYALTFDGPGGHAGSCLLHPLNLVVLQPAGEGDPAPVFRADGAVCALPELARAAGASGFLNAAPDADGILRRAPLLVEFQGQIYPSLSLAAVAAATRAREFALRVSNVNASTLALGNRRVQLDGRGNALLRFRGKKHTFQYLSAADILNGAADPPPALRGAIVFVGTTALGTREVVSTPLDTLFAGVEVQATVADNLLQGEFVRRPPAAAGIEGLMALALGAVVAYIVPGAGLLRAAIVAGTGLGILWGGALWLLSSFGVFVSPLFATAGLAAALPAATLAKFLAERRRADREGAEKATARRLMVQSLLSLTEVRDGETGRHSRRTQQYARVLAQQLAAHPGFRAYLTPERIDLLSSLAPLHDIGKVGVPDRVLNKPAALTPQELEEMRRHPAHGRDVILKAERDVGVRDDATLALAKEIVYTHHERWDGGGYPEGLHGEQIPVPGRLMAVVDVYDAAVSRALYRQPVSHAEAVELIARGAGTHFDPAIVEAFLAVAPAFERLSADDGPAGSG